MMYQERESERYEKPRSKELESGKKLASEYRNDSLLRAADGQCTEQVPVWLMRQAGRYDPRYLRLKEESGMTLYQLFRHPRLAAEISLLPRALGVDAIIFFQDILTPLAAMGAEFIFDNGPRLSHPLPDYLALKPCDVANQLSFVGDTLDLVHKELSGEMPVLGFAGAPLTLAAFILEGGSPKNGAPRLKQAIQHEPERLHVLLKKLTHATSDYLNYQITHGVAGVQLFESIAHLLTPEIYEDFALPYHQEIFATLDPSAITIMFARDFHDLHLIRRSGAKVLSLPSSVSIVTARQELGSETIVQGNISNRLLLEGKPPEIERAVRACIAAGEKRGHILNLSHGILPGTPYDNVRCLVQAAKNG